MKNQKELHSTPRHDTPKRTEKKRRKRKTIHIKIIYFLSTIYAISDIRCLSFFPLLKQEEKKTTQKSEIFTTRSLKGKRTDENIFSLFWYAIFFHEQQTAHVAVGSVIIGLNTLLPSRGRCRSASRRLWKLFPAKVFVLKSNSFARKHVAIVYSSAWE